jgi:S1-C subfamily serine protease
MAKTPDWEIPLPLQPDPRACSFDLDRALTAVIGVRATIPEDAFTASILGTERAGSGVLIRGDGLVLTIGYLVTEAETIGLTSADGQVAPGHVMAYDQETGFGLIQALRRMTLPALELGTASALRPEQQVIVAATGGRQHALKATIVARNEFAGYWEYLIDGAVFTAPAHPAWNGAALLDDHGRLCGIGSLHVQQRDREGGGPDDANMLVPIDLLPPILDELLTYGRPNHPPRPWLGLYAAEVGEAIVVAGLAPNGPAARAGIQLGDRVVGVGAEGVPSLAGLWRSVWALGPAGTLVPLRLQREGETLSIQIRSADRASFLKGPKLH